MKQIKKAIALLLYKIILLFVKLIPAKKGVKHLLIIKTDEIGDYILFRNLFKYFKKSGKYCDYKITILGNLAWKHLFDEYDANSCDEVIWLDKSKFKKNLGYRYSFLEKIRKIQTSDVINVVFSRSLDLDDGFAFIATGENKIAMMSDNINRGGRETNFDNIIYTDVRNAGDKQLFDSIRNKNFIQDVLEMSDVPIDTKVVVTSTSGGPKHDYIVLFIGAGNPERKWPIKYFVESAKYSFLKYGLIPIICGGNTDESDANEFMNLYDEKALNYTGKTSLLSMMELLNKAKFLICVDTGILHMAVAAGCPVIGLYSGKFYGRFGPYPKEISEEFYPVYPDFVDEMIGRKDPVLYDTAIMKNDTIKMINSTKVLPYIDKIMNVHK